MGKAPASEGGGYTETGRLDAGFFLAMIRGLRRDAWRRFGQLLG
jgi:hypothetical protein